MKNDYDELNDTFNTELEVQQVNENGCVRRKEATTDITDDIDKEFITHLARIHVESIWNS